MKDIPLEAQKPKYLFKRKLEPDFIFNSGTSNSSFLQCNSARYLDLKNTLEDMFRVSTGINGRARYSISYLVESSFITESEAISYLKKELYRLV